MDVTIWPVWISQPKDAALLVAKRRTDEARILKWEWIRDTRIEYGTQLPGRGWSTAA